MNCIQVFYLSVFEVKQVAARVKTNMCNSGLLHLTKSHMHTYKQTHTRAYTHTHTHVHAMIQRNVSSIHETIL